MILADTSAWVEYLRATGSQTHWRMRQIISEKEDLATTDVVIMEVLAGASTDGACARLRRLLLRCEFLPVEGLADFEAAASIYRHCRRNGKTVRKLTDCLIAAVALRNEIAVLHRDQDFDVIATHSNLQIAT